MRLLLKNIFRYSFKNKWSFISLFALFFICLFLFITLGLLIKNISRQYDALAKETNPHNVLINQNFDDNLQGNVDKANFELDILKTFVKSTNQPVLFSKQKQNKIPQSPVELEKELNSLNEQIISIQNIVDENNPQYSYVNLRDFNSLDLVGLNDEKFKLIKYLDTYKLDTLKIFDCAGLPIRNKKPSIPKNIDFNKVLELARADFYPTEHFTQTNIIPTADNIIDQSKTTKLNIWARQLIVFFISKSNWTSSEKNWFLNSANAFLNQLDLTQNNNNPQDPLKYKNNDTIKKINFEKYIIPFITNLDDNYKIDNKVFKIIFTNSTPTGDSVAIYEDFSSYLTIVSPMYLKNNHKEIFNYQQFIKETNYQGLKPNSLNQQEFTDFFNKIDDKYKVYIQSVPYLIIGTGITPDFTYPIISFENLVVNYKTESLLYANESGFSRAKNSWPTAPQENLILLKTKSNIKNINIDFAELLTKINTIGRQYMPNFPPSINIAYAANDKNNIYTPSPIRVSFLDDLIASVNTISIILTILLLLIAMFVTVILLKKFIKENVRSLFVIIANGFNKLKAILSVTVITMLPIILTSILTYIIAYFIQQPTINIFNSYWSIPITPTGPESIYIIPLAMLVCFAFTSILIFILTWISLSKPVSTGINFQGIKIGLFASSVKRVFSKVNVLHKFRISIAFSSVSKLLFLTLISSLSMSSIIFFTSTYKTFDKSIEPNIRSNQSDFAINLTTPTIQGGQYYGVDFSKIGQQLENEKKQIVNPSKYNEKGDNYYEYYNNTTKYLRTDLFKTWSQLHYPQTQDLTKSRTELNYLFNKVENQFLLDLYLGGNLIPSNPWTDIIAKMIPVNQLNTSIQKTKDLNSLLISDNRLFKNNVWNQLNSIKSGTINNPEKFYTLSTFNQQANCKVYLTNDINFINNKDEYPIIYLDKTKNIKEDVLNLLDSYKNWEIAKQGTDPITSLMKPYFNSDFIYPSGPTINPGEEFIKSVNLLDDKKTTLVIDLGSNENQNNLSTIRFIKYKNVYDKLFAPKLFAYIENNNVIEYKPGTDKYNQAVANLPKEQELVKSLIDNKEYVINKQNSSLFEDIFGIGIKSSPLLTNFADHVFSNKIYQNYLYKIIYNSVPLNQGDEPYVYVNFSLDTNLINSKYKHDKNINIQGIIDNSTKIHLKDINGNSIAFKDNKVIEDNGISVKELLVHDKDAYPLVINQFAAKQYNLGVGSIIQGKPINHVSRYSNGFQPNMFKLEVVAINDERKDAKFYVPMDTAQRILGLATKQDYASGTQISSQAFSSGIKPIADLNNKYNSFGGFNGIFTNDKNLSILSNSISLYSPAGTYLSLDTFKNDPNLISIIKRIMDNKSSDPNNQRDLELLSIALGITTQANIDALKQKYQACILEQDKTNFVNQIIKELNTKYEGYIYFSIPEKPSSLVSERTIFNSIASIVNNVETAIIVLVIVLSFVILLITSYIIITDFMKVILLLKTQGMSDFSNALNIFSVFIPVWLISSIITSPLVFFALKAFKEFVFTTMGILLSINISWFSFFISILSLAAIFSIIIGFVTLILKKINISNTLRWN